MNTAIYTNEFDPAELDEANEIVLKMIQRVRKQSVNNLRAQNMLPALLDTFNQTIRKKAA
ncbi:MAG: hypothetical protein JXQ90_03430 [Cyclobacteriaceae bacterium]